MTATIGDSDIDRYVAEVGAHLGALPEGERADLLDDLRQHLAEVAAEDDLPLSTRLGPAAAYAAELLASAGIGPRPPAPVGLAEQLRRWWPGSPLDRLQLGVRDFLPELRPAWWVLRAVLIVFGVAVWLANDWERTWLLPKGTTWMLLGIPPAVVLSVRHGKARGRLGLAVNVLAVGLAVYALGAMHGPTVTQGTVYERLPGLFTPEGAPITNLYPYDAEGRLLDGVLLYDQSGNPIVLRSQVEGEGYEVEARTDANGAPIDNAYPYRLVDPYEGQEGRSTTPPAVVVPRQAVETTTTTAGPSPTGPGAVPPS